MKIFWRVIKWLGIAVIITIIGFALYTAWNFIEIKIVTNPYKEYYRENTNESVLAPYLKLDITNKYQLGYWNYDEFGFIYISLFSNEEPIKSIKLYKTMGVIPVNVLDIPIEQRITNDVKLNKNVIVGEVYQDIPFREGYRFNSTIKYDKKIKILSSYMNGEIIKDEKVATDKYIYRLIYANQRKLAFCEDAKDLRKGVLYFYFERHGFINTDIAIVQMKNEPKNLYFVYAFDEYAGKNHEAIRNFMKDYFDIELKEDK